MLARDGGLQNIDADGRRVRAQADSGARAVPTVIAVLEDAGVATASVTVARPSLDDVYLRLTGRSFAEADTEAESGRGDREGVRR